MVVQNLYVPRDRTDRPALRRIRRLSLPFEIVFAALAILDALFFLIICWLLFFDGSRLLHLSVGAEGGEITLGDVSSYPPNNIAVSDLPLASRLAGLLVGTCVLGTQIAAFCCLHKLFGAYRRGIVFAEASIVWMRRAGFLLVAAGAAPLACQPLVRAAGLLDQRLFQSQSVAFLLVGAALFVLASIISLGREIEKEGEGYV